MSDNEPFFEEVQVYVKHMHGYRFNPLRRTASTPVLNTDALILSVTNKGVQVNMDCDPGEDPKKNKKYWQDVAGLRGAREEYLKYDLREVIGENSRLRYAVEFLTTKLNMAEKQNAVLKAERIRCRCQKEREYMPPPSRGLCL